MPDVVFKAKVQSVYNVDETLAFQFIKVPKLSRSHCDMDAFCKHQKFRSYVNSDLFNSLLSRQLSLKKITPILRLDRLPEGVKVDTSGFLAEVTITFD